MSRLALFLLGTFRATLNDDPVARFESDKVRALLAYLAVESHQPQRREKLATLLWPDRPERNARQNLSQALFNLRQAVGDREASPPFLLITPKTIQLNQASNCQVDTLEFEQTLARCQAQRHACDVCMEPLDQAIALYSGDFLEGLSLKDSPGFEEWALLKREYLRRLLIEALHRAADCYAQRGNTQVAFQHARRWVQLEPYQEEGHRRLMQLLAQSGQRRAALAQYHACRDILAGELGVEPAAETTALYNQISRQADASLPPKKAAPPHNMPTPLTAFVGRETELADIGAALQEPACRLLSLVGPGGVGKTRLALEVASAQRARYPDGVYIVSLAQIQESEALAPAVAGVIGCPLYDQPDPAQQLADHLRSRQMLLVLDSLEQLLAGPHARQVAAWLVELLKAAPNLTALITSRVRLRVSSEQVFWIAEMAYPAKTAAGDFLEYSSVRLFTQAARRALPAFDPTPETLPDIARICRLVRGVPLALLLAASWITILSPADIAAGIEKNLDFLKTTWRDVPRRQRSLRAVFDYSWELMTGEEQQLFLRMSVFRGGFTAQAAQSAAGVSLQMLLSLVDKSLLTRTPIGRYEMHELMHQFAAKKLDQTPDLANDAHRRHCAHYLTLLQSWDTTLRTVRQQAVLSEMDGELENVLGAWRWAVDQGMWAQLETALDGLCLFFLLRSRYQEGQIVCRKTADKLTPTTSPSQRRLLAQLLAWQGTLITPSKGSAALKQALHLLGHPAPKTRLGAGAGVAAEMARQAWYRLRPDEAANRPTAEKIDLQVAARTYERLTAIHYFANESAFTLYAALRSLNLAEAAGSTPELARGYATAGSIVSFVPLHRMAVYYFQRAQATVQQVEDITAKTWVFLVHGSYLAGVGQWERAREMLAQVVILAERTGDRYRWDDAVGNLAAIAYFQGDFDASLQLSDDYYTSARSRNDLHNQGWALRSKVSVLIPQAKFETALSCLAELEALVAENTQFEDSTLRADLYSLLSLAHLKQSNPDLALAAAERALDLHARVRPESYISLPGYRALAKTYLSLWQLARPPAPQPFSGYDISRLKSASKRACKGLAQFARIFPIGRPVADLYLGRYYWLLNRRRAAHRCWANSLAKATGLAMPYQQGLAHLEIGKHTVPDHSSHLQQAHNIFKSLNVGDHL